MGQAPGARDRWVDGGADGRGTGVSIRVPAGMQQQNAQQALRAEVGSRSAPASIRLLPAGESNWLEPSVGRPFENASDFLLELLAEPSCMGQSSSERALCATSGASLGGLGSPVEAAPGLLGVEDAKPDDAEVGEAPPLAEERALGLEGPCQFGEAELALEEPGHHAEAALGRSFDDVLGGAHTGDVPPALAPALQGRAEMLPHPPGVDSQPREQLRGRAQSRPSAPARVPGGLWAGGRRRRRVTGRRACGGLGGASRSGS